MENDRFYREAEKFFEDMKLPYDRKKMFLLANMLSDYALQGAVDKEVVNDAMQRIQKLKDIADSQ